MEEFSPAMLSVMFLKCLKMAGADSDSHGQFEYAECVEKAEKLCDYIAGVTISMLICITAGCPELWVGMVKRK